MSRCAGVWVWWCLGVLFLFTLVCLCLPACLPARLGCLPAGLGCLPAGLDCRPAGLACLGAGWPCLLGCKPALLAWVPARLACMNLNVSITRGTVPLTLVTERHDRIPSQPYDFGIKSSPNGRISNGRRPTSGRSLRHRQVHKHQVRMGQTWTPSELIPHFWEDFLARQGAGVCCVSRGACVACCDSTTVTGHVIQDICFMVSPSWLISFFVCLWPGYIGYLRLVVPCFSHWPTAGDSGRGSGCVSGSCVCVFQWYVVLGSCH